MPKSKSYVRVEGGILFHGRFIPDKLILENHANSIGSIAFIDIVKDYVLNCFPFIPPAAAISLASSLIATGQTIYLIHQSESIKARLLHVGCLLIHLSAAAGNIKVLTDFTKIARRMDAAFSPQSISEIRTGDTDVDSVTEYVGQWVRTLPDGTTNSAPSSSNDSDDDDPDYDDHNDNPQTFNLPSRIDQEATSIWDAGVPTACNKAVAKHADLANVQLRPDMDTLRWVQVGATIFYTALSAIAAGTGRSVASINAMFSLGDHVKKAATNVKDLTESILTDVMGQDLDGSKGLYTIYTDLLTRAEAFELKTAVDICSEGTTFTLRDLVKEMAAALNRRSIKFDNLSPSRTLLTASHSRLSSLLEVVWTRKRTNEHYIDPFVIQLVGEPGVGKTRFARYAADIINKELFEKPDMGIYQVNVGKKEFFWLPYAGQKVAFMDEFLAQGPDDPLIGVFNEVFSGSFYNLEGAAIDDKVQPREFELAILSSNQGRRVLRDAHHHFAPESEAALYGRIRSFEIVDPLVAGNRRLLNHRRPDFSHLTIYPVVYNFHGGGYIKHQAGPPISVRQLIDIMKDGVVAARGNKVVAGVAPPPPSVIPGNAPLNAANGHAAIHPGGLNHHNPPPNLLVNHAATPYIVHLNGPPHTNKTLYASTVLRNLASVYKLEYEHVDNFTVLPVEAKMYVVDDMIRLGENGNAHEYMSWLSHTPANSIVVICSNLDIVFRRESLTSRLAKYAVSFVKTTFPQNHLEVPNLGDVSGIARRLALSGSIKSLPSQNRREKNFINPHCGIFVQTQASGRQFWTGLDFQPVSDTMLTNTIEHGYIKHVRNSGGRVKLNVMSISETTADVVVTAPDIQGLKFMLDHPTRLIAAYASPQKPLHGTPRVGVWVSKRTESMNLGGVGYWGYTGPLTCEDELLDLTEEYTTRMSALGNDFTCLVHVGQFKAYVSGNIIKVTSNPYIVDHISENDNGANITLVKLNEPDITLTIVTDEVEYIMNGQWHLTKLSLIPLVFKTLLLDALTNDPRLASTRTNGMVHHHARARKIWMLTTLKNVKDFVVQNKWALLIGGAALLVLMIKAFKSNPISTPRNDFDRAWNKVRKTTTDEDIEREKLSYYQLNWMEDKQNLLGMSRKEIYDLLCDLPLGCFKHWRQEYPFISKCMPIDVNDRLELESHVMYMSDGEYESWLATLDSGDAALRRRTVVDKDLYDGIAEATRGRVTRSTYLQAFNSPEDKKQWKSKPRGDGYDHDARVRFRPRKQDKHHADRQYEEYSSRVRGEWQDLGHAVEFRPDMVAPLGNSQPIEDLSVKTQKARVGVITGEGKVYGLHLEDGFILTVYHVVANIINTPDTKPWIISDEYKGPSEIVYHDKSRDIAILRAPHAHWPSTIKRFTENLPNEFMGSIIMNRLVPTVLTGATIFFEEIGCEYTEIKNELSPSEFRKSVYHTITPNATHGTRAGDCGSPLLSADHGGTIVGIYTAYATGTRSAVSTGMTRRELEDIIKSIRACDVLNLTPHSLKEEAVEVDRVVDDWTNSNLSCARSDFPMGSLNVVARWKPSFFIPTRPGNWIQSPVAHLLPAHKKPIVVEPKLLESKNVILPANSIGQRSVKVALAQKFVRERRAPKLDLLKAIAREAARHHFPTSVVRKFTFDEVVYGLPISDPFYPNFTVSPLDTSAGEYFRARWKVVNKSDMFKKNRDKTVDYSTGRPVVQNQNAYDDLKNRVDYIDELARKGETLMVIHKACVKDELLKIDKADRAFGRLFYSCDWALNIWLNMNFGAVFASMRACHQHASWKVGINMETGFHNMIVGHLKKSKNVLCADAANWDISMHPNTIKAAQEFISQVCYVSKKYDTTNLKNITKVAARYRAESFILVEDSVVKVDGIMTSGITGTSEVNSIMHLIMYIHAVNKQFSDIPVSVSTFTTHAEFSSYGDDAKISVDEVLQDILSDKNVCVMYDDFGVTATNDTKDGPPVTVPITEGSLCSRTPVWCKEFNVWLPALKKNTIESMISWSRTGLPADLAVRCRTAALYAAAWGKEYYDFICHIINQMPPEYRNSQSWREVGPLEPHGVVLSFLSQLMRGQTELTFKGFSDERRKFYQSLINNNSLIPNMSNQAQFYEKFINTVLTASRALDKLKNDQLGAIHKFTVKAAELGYDVPLSTEKVEIAIVSLTAHTDELVALVSALREETVERRDVQMELTVDEMRAVLKMRNLKITPDMEASPLMPAPSAPTHKPSSAPASAAQVDLNAPLDQQIVLPETLPAMGAIPFNDTGVGIVMQDAQIPDLMMNTGNRMDIKVACHQFYDFATEPFLVTGTIPVGTVVACVNFGKNAMSPRAQNYINLHKNWNGEIHIRANIVSNSLNQGQLLIGVVDTDESHDLINGVLIPKKNVSLDTLQVKDPVIVDMNRNYTQVFVLKDMRRRNMWRRTDESDADYFDSNMSLIAYVYTAVSANAKDSMIEIPLRFQSAWFGTATNPKPLTGNSDASIAGLEQARIVDLIPNDERIIIASDYAYNHPTTPESVGDNKTSNFMTVKVADGPNTSDYMQMNTSRYCPSGAVMQHLFGDACRENNAVNPNSDNVDDAAQYFGQGTTYWASLNRFYINEKNAQMFTITDGPPLTPVSYQLEVGALVRMWTVETNKGTQRYYYIKTGKISNAAYSKEILVDTDYYDASIDTPVSYKCYVAGVRNPPKFAPIRFANVPTFVKSNPPIGAWTIPMSRAETLLRKLFNRIGFNVSFKIMDPDGYEITTVCFINGSFFYTGRAFKYSPVDMRTCRISNVTRLSTNVAPPAEDLPEERIVVDAVSRAEVDSLHHIIKELEQRILGSPLNLTSFDDLRDAIHSRQGPLAPQMIALGAALSAAGEQSDRWGHKVFDRRTQQQLSAQQFNQAQQLQTNAQSWKTDYTQMMMANELQNKKDYYQYQFDYSTGYNAQLSASSLNYNQNANVSASTQTYGPGQPKVMYPSNRPANSVAQPRAKASSGTQYNVGDTKTHATSGQQTYGASQPTEMMPGKYVRSSYSQPPGKASQSSGHSDTRGYAYSTGYPSQVRGQYAYVPPTRSATASTQVDAADTTAQGGKPSKPASH